MFGSIWDDVKRNFSSGDMVIKLILINIGAFVGVWLISFLLIPITGIGPDSDPLKPITDWLMVPSDPIKLLQRPWTILTYMFLHEGLFHILWNMLFLYWFGNILQDLLGKHRILPIYILGGLAGFLLYFFSANLLPDSFSRFVGGQMLGASAGVMAIVVAAAVTAPTYSIRLILLGPVQIRYIALFMIFLDLISIRQGSNTGGHLAHLGGVFMGYFFVSQLRQGSDWGIPFNNFVRRVENFFAQLFGKKSSAPQRRRPKVVYKDPDIRSKMKRKGQRKSDVAPTISHQERLDAILDKIKMSGYENLTEEEKDFLYKASKD